MLTLLVVCIIEFHTSPIEQNYINTFKILYEYNNPIYMARKVISYIAYGANA